MSDKKQEPLNAVAINALIGDRYLESACRSLDEANRALEAENPVLYRKLEEHARQLRERQREQADKDTPTPTEN